MIKTVTSSQINFQEVRKLKKITIKDIAKKSGVSTATVSRVINSSGYVSAEIKEKVLTVVKELNYRPNAIARSLKTHKTNTIGIIIPDISNPYFMKISKGIEDTMEESGYILIFLSSNENSKQELKAVQTLLDNRVDAIVLASSNPKNEPIKKIGIPLVLVDRVISNSMDFHYVVEDNFHGAYLLTKHFIKKGHTNIGVINGLLSVSTGVDRYMGYKKALSDFGLDEIPEFTFNGKFMIEDGENAVAHFFQHTENPTAILSFNNMMTMGAILKLNRMGLSIPEDISIGSYGKTEISQLLPPAGVVSVKQFPYQIGVRIGEILLDELLHHKSDLVHDVLKPTLNF